MSAVALLISGCGGSSVSKPKGTAQVPSAELQRAAYVSSGTQGFKVNYTMHETASGVSALITGTGSFAIPTKSGSMSMHMSLPSLGSLPIQLVVANETIYFKLPPVLSSKLPGGKPWLEISLAQLGKATGLQALSSLFSGSFSPENPGQYLQFLRAASSGSVKDLGPATINGVKTTHYHATVELTKLPGAVPAASRQAIKQLVSVLRSRGGTGLLPIDAWIDSSNLIRQVALTWSQPLGNGSTANVAMKQDFLQYGPQPAPAIPPASQTENLLSLTHGQP